jgi:hypothetical protein
LRRLKAGKGAEDLVHHKLAFIGSGQVTMPWRCSTLCRPLGRFDPEAYAAFHSCSEEALVRRRLVWWLIAIMLAIEAFLHHASGIRYSSTAPAPD